MSDPTRSRPLRRRCSLLPALVLAAAAIAAPTAAARRVAVLYEAGDDNSETGAANVSDVFAARGFSVSTFTGMPGDLGPYCCLWDLRPRAILSGSEATRIRDFLRDGHGVFLVGENQGCCGFRDDNIIAVVRDTLGGGGSLALGPVDGVGTFPQDAVASNPVTRSPNIVHVVTYNGVGTATFAGTGSGRALTDGGGIDPVAASWSEGALSAAREGRLAMVLDINWLDTTYGLTDNEELVENLSHFLCPSLVASLAVTITSPGSYALPCPATLDVNGRVDGSDPDCAQPTTLDEVASGLQASTPVRSGPHGPGDEPGIRPDRAPTSLAGGTSAAAATPSRAEATAAPTPMSGRITRIEVSVAGGPWTAVSTSPGLPAFPPVTFHADDLPLPLGASRVDVRAFDESGAIATDTVFGSVHDHVPPVLDAAACADLFVDLGAGCALDYAGVPAAVDACDPTLTVVATPPLPFHFGGPGTQVFHYEVRDDSGNRASCDRTVTTVDLSAPALTCPPATTLECTSGGRPADDVDVLAWLALASASDNCTASPPVTHDPVAFLPSGCTPGLGTDIVFRTVDASGLEAACTGTLRVEDTTAPVVTGDPGPLTLECSAPGGVPAGDASVVAWLGAFAATDLCEGTATLSNDAPALLPVACTGPGTTVTFTAADSCRNEATLAAVATVRDRTPPIVVRPLPIAVECRDHSGVPRTDPAIAAWLATASATDVCSVPVITHDAPEWFPPACGASFDVHFSATDGCGLTDLETTSVSVRDGTPPVVTAPPELTVECSVPGGTLATEPAVAGWRALATAADACHDATLTDDLPALVPAGCGLTGTRTPIRFTGTDACSNHADAASAITVTDTSAPVFGPGPGDLILACDAGLGGLPSSDPRIAAWLASASAADVCGTTTITHDAPPFVPVACTPGAITPVHFTAVDGCGNAAEVLFRIAINDSTPPALSLPADLVLECDGAGGIAASDARIVAWLGAASASDACSPPTLTHDAPPFFASGCGPVGHATVVHFRAVDGCGRETTGSATVTVRDGIAPVLAVPPPLTLECTSPLGVPAGDSAIVAWLASASAADACGPATLTSDAPAVYPSACGPGAVTTVTFRSVDGCGNVSLATSTVTVRDTTAPTVTAPPPLALECNGPGGVPATDPAIAAWLAAATASDSCSGGTTFTNDAPALLGSGCAPGAVTPVTFTGTDACGNAASAGSSVTVADTTPPSLSGCGFTPWDPILGAPLPPTAPASPASCAASGTFRIDCGSAVDLCLTEPITRTAEMVLRRHEAPGGACSEVEERVTLACDEIVELHLLPAICPARPPREPEPPVSERPDGTRVLSAERFELRVVAADGCGNASATCAVDPATTPDPTDPTHPLLCPPAPARCRVPVCDDWPPLAPPGGSAAGANGSGAG